MENMLLQLSLGDKIRKTSFLLRNYAFRENWLRNAGKAVSATLSHISLLILEKLEIGYLRLNLHENH
jgi:hypothetical protein